MKILCVGCFLSLFYIIWGRTAEENIPKRNDSRSYNPNLCFYRPEIDCPPVTESCRCRKLSGYPQAIVCCNVNETLLTEGLGPGCVGIQLIILLQFCAVFV